MKYIGYKIRLYPNNVQVLEFKNYFGACRYVYNFGIDVQEDHYKKSLSDDKIKYKTLSFISLNNLLTSHKKDNEWLYDYDSTTLKLVLLDVKRAYKTYFDKQNNHPKHKKKKSNKQSFPIRDERLIINDTDVYIPSIGNVYTGHHNHIECIGCGNKDKKNSTHKHFVNSRVIYDGIYYWLCFSLPQEDCIVEANSCKRFKNNEIWEHKNYSEPVGIDLGCRMKSWIVDSNGTRINRPNTYKENRKIGKYQKKLAIKRKVNKEKMINSTVADKLKEPNYTKNELKILNKLNKAYTRKRNKKKNAIHEYACSLIASKPKAVVMETLSLNSMYIKEKGNLTNMQMKKYNEMVKDSMLYTVRHIIETKCEANNIPFILADKEFPSSQLCSCCGYRQKIGSSKVYKCPYCGNSIDRDLNAARNLSFIAYDDFYEYDYIV